MQRTSRGMQRTERESTLCSDGEKKIERTRMGGLLLGRFFRNFCFLHFLLQISSELSNWILTFKQNLYICLHTLGFCFFSSLSGESLLELY